MDMHKGSRQFQESMASNSSTILFGKKCKPGVRMYYTYIHTSTVMDEDGQKIMGCNCTVLHMLGTQSAIMYRAAHAVRKNKHTIGASHTYHRPQ